MDILEAPGRATPSGPDLPGSVLLDSAAPVAALPAPESASESSSESGEPSATAEATADLLADEDVWIPCQTKRSRLLSWPAAIVAVFALLFVGGSIYLVVVLDSLAAHAASFTSQLTSIVGNPRLSAGALGG